MKNLTTVLIFGLLFYICCAGLCDSIRINNLSNRVEVLEKNK